MKTTEVLLSKLIEGVIRVVYYFKSQGCGFGRGVVEFKDKTLLDVLLWIETNLYFEKEKVTTV